MRLQLTGCQLWLAQLFIIFLAFKKREALRKKRELQEMLKAPGPSLPFLSAPNLSLEKAPRKSSSTLGWEAGFSPLVIRTLKNLGFT